MRRYKDAVKIVGQDAKGNNIEMELKHQRARYIDKTPTSP